MKTIKFEETQIAIKLANYKLPRHEELTSFFIPMRQLIKLLDNYLSIFIVANEEPFITRTMINSYVYQKIIRPPENKDYDKRHIIHLISIGILKQVLSMSDVASLIKLQIEQYPIDIAYNYFCDELENALYTVFKTRNFEELSSKICPSKITPLSEQVRSAVFAFANAMYVKHSLYHSLNI